MLVAIGAMPAAAAAQAPTQVRVGPLVTSIGGAPQISTAQCLAGEEALGGGYDTEAATSSTIVHTSRPDPSTAGGTPTGWQSVVTNGKIQSFVVCVPAAWGNPQVRQVTASGSGAVNAQVFCPAANERATGGGFDTSSATTSTIVNTSRPIHDAGGVRGWDVVATDGAPLTAYVICTLEATTTFSTHVAAIPNAGPVATTISCAPGLTATGGGFDTNAADAADIVNTSRPSPPAEGATVTGWQAYVTGATGTVTVICTQPGTPPGPTYSATVLGDGPVGYWRFGEPSGPTAIDSSGNNHHGTYLGGPLLGQPGALAGDPDTAVLLDGVDDVVRVPDAAGLDMGDQFTLEGWIKRSSDAKSHALFNKGSGGLHLVVMNAGAGNKVHLRKTNVSTIATSTAAVPADGLFHHIAATKIGTTVKIYVDGVEGTTPVSPIQVVQNTAFPLLFGSGGTLPATIDEFAIYDQVLTGAEIAAHYAAGTT